MKDKLDEWIYFFKNAEIKTGFSAKGLKAAIERLDEMKLSEKDAKEYKRYLKELRDIASEQHTKMADAQDLFNKGIHKGRAEKEIEFILEMHREGLPIRQIAKISKNQRKKFLKSLIINNFPPASTPEYIPVTNQPYILPAVATPEQFRNQIGIRRYILEPCWQ